MSKPLPIQYLITFNESSHDLRFCYLSLRIEFIFLFVSSYMYVHMYKNISKTLMTQHNIKAKYVPNAPNTIFDQFSWNITWSSLLLPFPTDRVHIFICFFIHVRVYVWEYLQNLPDTILKWNMSKTLPVQYLITAFLILLHICVL